MLWLWHRPAASYAVGVALKGQKTKKKREKKTERMGIEEFKISSKKILSRILFVCLF